MEVILHPYADIDYANIAVYDMRSNESDSPCEYEDSEDSPTEYTDIEIDNMLYIFRTDN